MHTGTVRAMLATAVLALVIGWPGSAHADTINGTAGEIGIVGYQGFGAVRFKLTDVNQTKSCTTFAGYAWFRNYVIIDTVNQQVKSGEVNHREWYAALLVSKKGAPIACDMTAPPECRITACTLP